MSQTSDLWVSRNLDSDLTAGDNSPETHKPDESFITILCGSLAVLWKDWPTDMEISIINDAQFSLRGVCPHCDSKSVFVMIGSPHVEASRTEGNRHRIASIMQCQGCLKLVLGLTIRHFSKWEYETHYPLGTPRDAVDEHVPDQIAEDFAEAMRCLFVGSPKAAVAMCRRSVEASCNDLGAKGKNLKAKINDLAEKRKITDSLQAMAHAVRLTANAQLHKKKRNKAKEALEEIRDADEGTERVSEIVTTDLDTFGESDAKKMIGFVKHFFYHVYTVPHLLESYLEGETPESSQADSVQNDGSMPNSKTD